MSSSTAKPKTTKRASCLCKGVAFTVTGVDRGSVVCHCVNCQKGSGSAFAHNHQMTEAEVAYTHGKELVKAFADKDTKSGNVLSRSFCSECGSNLFISTTQTKGLIVLNSGALDEPKTAPKREFFQDNREKWMSALATGMAKI